MRKITTEIIKSFNNYLINEEKSAATVNKYMHDVCEFQIWLGNQALCKTAVLAYKSAVVLCKNFLFHLLFSKIFFRSYANKKCA